MQPSAQRAEHTQADAHATADASTDVAADGPRGSFWEVLAVSSRLGISCFGGPIAHLGYFRDEYVVRRRWLDETTYADLIALFQFLPGPTSSELGISIGVLRAGKWGGLAAWLGFTLPSALALTLFAFGLQRFDLANAPWVHGLQLVAVAVVAQAVWGMAKQFLTDELRIAIAIGTTLVLLFVPSSVGQVAVILVAGLLGWRLLAPASSSFHPHVGVPISNRFGLAAWMAFLVLLLGLPLVSLVLDVDRDGALALFQGFYGSGALVFGGGHVVLPLLQAVVVPRNWMENSVFLAGYGAAQAVPGPLFTFAAFLGAARAPSPNGVLGAAIGLVAIFLPGALLVYASLPFWNTFRQHAGFQRALSGINASVVGILLAALYLTIWSPTVREASDFGVVLVSFALLTIWKRPPWQVVVLGALAGAAIGWLH